MLTSPLLSTAITLGELNKSLLVSDEEGSVEYNLFSVGKLLLLVAGLNASTEAVSRHVTKNDFIRCITIKF
jgi:hypothetical protein